MNKQDYEKNPKSYWEIKEMIGKPSALATVPTREESPLWVDQVLPNVEAHTPREVCADLGCGAGRYMGLAAEYFDKVIGVDFSKHSIMQAEMLMTNGGVENVEFVHTSLADMSQIEDNSVDFAYTCAVFMHMPNYVKEQAIPELARILKPGGEAVLLEIFFGDNTAFDCPAISIEDWVAMIKKAGLEVEVIDADPFKKYVVRKA